jgi:biopolymer transport protein ExbD
MAELNVSSGGAHKKGRGVKKGKKLSTRVDLTPMVDLGFLLITFFIFTTTMSEAKVMHLVLPKDVKNHPNEAKASAVITLILGNNDKVYYYERDSAQTMKPTDFKRLRDIVIDKKNRTDPADFMVIIKSTNEATFKNSVNVLDEMTIDGVKRYAMVDISPVEDDFIRKTENANDNK